MSEIVWDGPIDCLDCGHQRHVTAIRAEPDGIGWHLMIETDCPNCRAHDVIDARLTPRLASDEEQELAYLRSERDRLLRLLKAGAGADSPEYQQAILPDDLDAARAEAEERGIPQYDAQGFEIGRKLPTDPADL